MKIAVVGSGIAGMGCAYYLRDRFDVEVFEKDGRVGGHTNTVQVADPKGTIGIDTGFIVHNPQNYPKLCALFSELGVSTKKSDMSFSMYSRPEGLQFSGQGLSTLFAQKRNLLRPAYIKFLLQANRFNSTAARDLEAGHADMSLAEYLQKNRYDEYFIHNFIFPMASAVWSTPPELITTFHAASFIRFFVNHGFLGLSGGQEWRTVEGGSCAYMDVLRSRLRRPVRTGKRVISVRRVPDGVLLQLDGEEHRFDRVVLAAHADESLAMLSDATPFERETLSAFQYTTNRATLHFDESVMPPLRKVWSSWNYKSSIADRQIRTATVYYMNRLQRLDAARNYFVSINEIDPVRPDAVLAEFEYRHPVFNSETTKKQAVFGRLNEGPVYFAGSYAAYGFHEDALRSAAAVAEVIR